MRGRRLCGVWLALLVIGVGPAEAIDEACEQSDLRGADLSDLDCAGLDRPEADLSPAEGPPEVPTRIEGTDFTQAILSAANMTRVQGGCTTESCTLFDQAVLDASLWSEASLGSVSFVGAVLAAADFSGADLTDADLTDADLDGADLATATLSGVRATGLVQCPAELPADWSCLASSLVGPGADLRGVDLSGANLSGLDLGGATFEGADLTLAYLDGATALCEPDACPADFSGAILEFVSLQDADLASSSFLGADLRDANLARATLTGATLSGAILSFSWLPGIRLAEADLSLARLDYAQGACTSAPEGSSDPGDWCPDFSGADLTGADLKRASIVGAIMTETDLSEADLSEANLDELSIPCGEPEEEGGAFGCLQVSGMSAQPTNMTSLLSRDADWAGVDLRDVSAKGADFSATFFYKVRTIEPEEGEAFDQVYRADLSGGDFEGASFRTAELSSVDLSGATLSGADFGSALMSGVTLSDADLGGSLLDDADLTGAQMNSGTGLADTDFSKAILREADLRSVDFQNADFARGAVIEDGTCVLPTGGLEVDLVGAQLSDANFSASPHFFQGCISVDATTTYSAETRFPDGFDLQGEMTIQVPEPLWVGLQGAALAGLAFLRAGQQRKTSRPRS